MAETKEVSSPLVSIGIPAFEREAFIGEAIRSALAQSYRNIEVIVSDNGSSDGTFARIEEIAAIDGRVRIFRQKNNLGPTRNFEFVLRQSHGEYFLWLGDDDWLDSGYVETCLAKLRANPGLSVCGGLPVYYATGASPTEGRGIEIVDQSPAARIFQYLKQVSDNGIFYGLMRREILARAPIRNCMGWDWIMFTSLAYQGGISTVPEVKVHRRLGGATSSYVRIVQVMNLPNWNAHFPFLAIILAMNKELWRSPHSYPGLGFLGRIRYSLCFSFTVLWYKSLRAAYYRISKF